MRTPYYRTNVSVDRDVWQRLKKQGFAGDSLNDVIRRLLDEKEGRMKKAASGLTGSGAKNSPKSSSTVATELSPSL